MFVRLKITRKNSEILYKDVVDGKLDFFIEYFKKVINDIELIEVVGDVEEPDIE